MSANYYRSLFAILHSIKNQFPLLIDITLKTCQIQLIMMKFSREFLLNTANTETRQPDRDRPFRICRIKKRYVISPVQRQE
jgi:hypothetical protein